MKIEKICLLWVMMLTLLLSTGFVHATNNIGMEMDFKGTLVNEPCTVDPNDTDIQLDFGTIVDKYLYLNTRTHSQPFTIHLQDCNIDNWPGEGTVTVHFDGAGDPELPGYLAMSDTTIGAAVGLEQEDGTFLPLGKTSAPVQLSDGTIALNFKAFVEGESQAIAGKTIKRGNFSATATFFLDYP